MSRFGNLEFGEEHGGEFQPEAVTDEAFYLREAQQSYEEGDFEHALRSFARVLDHNAANAAAWTGQVKMLVELGEFREAKLWADKALEQFPREPELLAAKAVALARLGELEPALAFSDAAIEERGETPYIWIARGDVLLARSEQTAAYCFERALVSSDGGWFTRWLISRTYFFYRKFSLALRMLLERAAGESVSTAVWVQIGLCYSELGQSALARHSMEQALELNPQNRAASVALERINRHDWFHWVRGRVRKLFLR